MSKTIYNADCIVEVMSVRDCKDINPDVTGMMGPKCGFYVNIYCSTVRANGKCKHGYGVND